MHVKTRVSSERWEWLTKTVSDFRVKRLGLISAKMGIQQSHQRETMVSHL